MRKQSILLLFAFLLAAATVTCSADEIAEKGRDIFKQHQHAVVTVQVVVKIAIPGLPSPPRTGRTSPARWLILPG